MEILGSILQILMAAIVVKVAWPILFPPKPRVWTEEEIQQGIKERIEFEEILDRFEDHLVFGKRDERK